jgi:excisionase family DNA binding protein
MVKKRNIGRSQPVPLGEQPWAYSISKAAQLIDVAPATMERLVSSNRVASIKVGRRRLIPAGALRRLIDEGMPPGPAAA